MDDDTEFERQLAQGGRRRRIGLAIGAGVAVLLVGSGAAWALTQPDPRCDRGDASVLLSNSRLPAEAVHRVCEFPEPLADTLQLMEASPPGFRDVVALRVATEDPALFEGFCGGATEAFARSAQTGTVDPLIERCDLSVLGTDDELRRASLGDVTLAIAVYASLAETDGSIAAPLAKRMLD